MDVDAQLEANGAVCRSSVVPPFAFKFVGKIPSSLTVQVTVQPLSFLFLRQRPITQNIVHQRLFTWPLTNRSQFPPGLLTSFSATGPYSPTSVTLSLPLRPTHTNIGLRQFCSRFPRIVPPDMLAWPHLEYCDRKIARLRSRILVLPVG